MGRGSGDSSVPVVVVRWKEEEKEGGNQVWKEVERERKNSERVLFTGKVSAPLPPLCIRM